MQGASKNKIEVINDTIRGIIHEGRSSLVRLKRVPFDDPLLTVYFVKGRPIMANSFVVHKPWYVGLLSGDELDKARDNLVAYAYRKYGDKLFTHLEEYTRTVMERVISEIKKNDWDFNISVSDLRDEVIKRLFGTGSDLSFKVGEKSSLSLLPELNSMGVTSVSFIEEGDTSDDKFNVLKDIYERILSFGIGGHYVLFFPYTAVIHGQIKGKDFIGEMEYGPNVSRIFPLLKREVGGVPKLLEEFPWETSGKLSFGRPFAMYLRYKNRGVYICFRSKEESLYVCSLELSTPERVVSKVEKMREKAFEVVEKVIRDVRDMPRSVLRIKISGHIRKFPHPEDLKKAIKLSFGV